MLTTANILCILNILSHYLSMYLDLYFGKCHSKYSISEIPPHSASDNLTNLENSMKKLNRKSLGAFLQGRQYPATWNDKHMVPRGRESVTQENESRLGFYRSQKERDILIRNDFFKTPKYYILFVI